MRKRSTRRDIAATDGQFPYSILSGYDPGHQVSDVRFEGLTSHGRPIRSAKEGHISLDNAAGIRWK